MDFAKTDIANFIETLASKAPVPGGGGASALVGAVGTALGNMVGSLTAGKPKFAAVEPDIQRLKVRATALQDELIALMSLDAEVFEPLSKAYSLPSATDAEKAHKQEVMEVCLIECSDVPLRIMEKCCEAIDLHAEFAEKGTPIAISDVGVGVVFCKAALQGASLNVFINTKSMQDRDFATATNAKANAMLDEYTAKADTIFADVSGRLT
jgi:formiminotetrahydrofolate cyclodeaminase